MSNSAPSYNPKATVLIVGAGAMGVVVGYHLSLGGTAVTFLVRPRRLQALQAPQRLYCYDDHQIKEYSAYQVVSSPAEVAAQRFDYVLFTLDGAACRSDEGTLLLRELGDAIRPTSAVMIMGGVGIGLREHIIETTRLPDNRLLEGTLGTVSHQVQGADMHLHPPTDPVKLAQASLAYHHFPSKVGFMLVPHPKKVARDFAVLYDRCGISRCTLMNATVYRIYTNVFYTFTAACDMAGWPSAAGLAANRELFSLCLGAMKDIIGLPQHGWIGKLIRIVLSKKMLFNIISKLERESLPLDVHTFNRFHHGGKVLAQDLQVMHNCVLAGEGAGLSMASLKELLRKYEAFRRQPAAT